MDASHKEFHSLLVKLTAHSAAPQCLPGINVL